MTIDSLMSDYDLARIDILKLDIEGGEKEVLECCDSWIESVDLIVAELHDRIVPGCESTFEKATQSFAQSYQSGEKMVAQR